MSIQTVGDLVAALTQMPQDLPVLVGCHFDNDNGLTNQVYVSDTYVEHSEAEFFIEVDPTGGYTGAFRAVTVS